MDARPVLGVQQLRPPFLDDIPTAQPRKSEAGHRTGVLKMSDYLLDDSDDDLDDDEDDESDGEDDDGDEEDEDDEDIETWQVSQPIPFR